MLEPFNLRNEREGGFFDENMNYVFKKEHGEVDAWISGLDEAAVETAIGEAALAEKRRQAKLAEADAHRDSQQTLSTAELKEELLGILLPGETIASAMRRLSGKSTSSSTSSGIKRRRSTPKEVHTSSAEQKKQQLLTAKSNLRVLERATEVADQLLAGGLSGVYDMTREALQASTVSWEYQGADGRVYGPYSSQDIAGWKAAGFLTGPTAVLIRQVRQTPRAQTLSIYDDEDEDLEDGKAAKRAKLSTPEEVAAAWVSSDAIDFGVFVNLDTEAQQYEGKEEEDKHTVNNSHSSRVPFSAQGGGEGGLRAEDVESDDEG